MSPNTTFTKFCCRFRSMLAFSEQNSFVHFLKIEHKCFYGFFYTIPVDLILFKHFSLHIMNSLFPRITDDTRKSRRSMADLVNLNKSVIIK